MVLVALKRSSSELSSYQKKILPVDDHVGVAIAGLTSDGRRLRYVCVGGEPGYFRREGVWESEGCGYGGVQCACVGREWEVLYLGEGECVCGESSSSSAASS